MEAAKSITPENAPSVTSSPSTITSTTGPGIPTLVQPGATPLPPAPLFDQYLDRLFKVIESICKAVMGSNLRGSAYMGYIKYISHYRLNGAQEQHRLFADIWNKYQPMILGGNDGWLSDTGLTLIPIGAESEASDSSDEDKKKKKKKKKVPPCCELSTFYKAAKDLGEPLSTKYMTEMRECLYALFDVLLPENQMPAKTILRGFYARQNAQPAGNGVNDFMGTLLKIASVINIDRIINEDNPDNMVDGCLGDLSKAGINFNLPDESLRTVKGVISGLKTKVETATKNSRERKRERKEREMKAQVQSTGEKQLSTDMATLAIKDGNTPGSNNNAPINTTGSAANSVASNNSGSNTGTNVPDSKPTSLIDLD